jgi:hypothetical protein
MSQTYASRLETRILRASAAGHRGRAIPKREAIRAPRRTMRWLTGATGHAEAAASSHTGGTA